MRSELLPPQTLVAVLFAIGLLAAPFRTRAAEPVFPGSSSTVTNPAAAMPEKKNGAIEDSVVKVFSTLRLPDLYKPWTKQSPEDVTGSGVVIEGKRILTNAHVVRHASQVQIQANQAGDKIFATVEAMAPDMDLAVLKLEDEKFFDTHPALPRAKTLPGVKDMVLAYGYPEGGNSLSITKGIVSRVEFAYYHFPIAGLRIQIDAAINPGNSGGPAVVGDKMIGLTFSRLAEADNIGYIIPSEEIDLFLDGVARSHYEGKPGLYDELQTLENPALRSFLKLDPSVHGMVVGKPYRAEAAYPLKTWDVITKIGDLPVDDQGMIKLGDQLRLSFLYEVQLLAKNGKVPLTVVRHSREMNLEQPVSPDYPKLIPALGDGYPSYFIYGPMVFSEATEDYLDGWARTKYGSSFLTRLSALGNPLVTRMDDQPQFDGERLVVVASPFFPHKLAQGYSSPMSEVIRSINGIRIKNLAHLVAVLRDCQAEFVTVEFDARLSETMVFPRAQMVAATDDILTDNGVRAQGSADMLGIWNAKGK
jgi:S1-C subfamily serine protease